MDYISFDPQRYAPSPSIARKHGDKDLWSIAPWVGKQKDQRILEVGCGCGCLLLALTERGYGNCQGVDLNESLIKHGRNVLGVNIVLGNWIECLEKKKNGAKFDVIIALDVLEHLPLGEIDSALKMTHSWLAPGGRFIFRVPNALCPFSTALLFGDLTHQFLTTPHSLTHLLKQSGFTAQIAVNECRPAHPVKRFFFKAVHSLIVKPLFGLAYYHFHGVFPSHLTPNIIGCAYKDH